MKTALFFGSFNPIHIGHTAIANYMHEFTDLDEICFIVSPHNPLKTRTSLLADYHRLRLVEKAIEDDLRFTVSDIEYKMPQPSYTIDTLLHLSEKHKNKHFCLIMGSDTLATLHKWKNAEELVKNYPLYIYPRQNANNRYPQALEPLIKIAKIELVEAPKIEISGSFIRNSIKSGKNIRHFLPHKVWQYIDEMNFYR